MTTSDAARRTICCRLPRWAATATGLTLMGVALFAYRLGIDPNPAWGPYRTGLLVAGVIVMAIGQSSILLRALKVAGARLQKRLPPNAWVSRSWIVLKGVFSEAVPLQEPQTRPGRIPHRLAAPMLLALFLGMIGLYVWFVSVGFWSNWPDTTTYYDMLADGFLQGTTAVPLIPDPRLAELQDPYPISARENITVLWDASYYAGKYYLYWGPAPAVLLVPIKLVSGWEIGDEVIVFGSAVVLFTFSALTILRLWRKMGAGLPGWLVVPPLFLAGVAHPILWVLNRPAIHEAAIATGAAFLMAGIYFSSRLLMTGEIRPAEVALASGMWGLALASRASLAGAIVVLVAAVAVRIFQALRKGPRRPVYMALAGLGLPLLLTILSLATYNTARFGNPLETGWRYVLSGRNENHEDFWQVMNPLYAIPNTYNYIARGFRTLTVFPFIKPIWGRGSLSPFPVALPKMYYADQITGLAVASPFVLFAAYLVWSLACEQAGCSGHNKSQAQAHPAVADPGARFLLWTLAAATLTAFLPIVLFFSVTSRYLLDVSPLAIVLAGAGSWVAFRRGQGIRGVRAIVALGILLAAALTGILSFLLAVTGFEARFEHLNPVLFDWITRALAW